MKESSRKDASRYNWEVRSYHFIHVLNGLGSSLSVHAFREGMVRRVSHLWDSDRQPNPQRLPQDSTGSVKTTTALPTRLPSLSSSYAFCISWKPDL